jgi:hypothetical protein
MPPDSVPTYFSQLAVKVATSYITRTPQLHAQATATARHHTAQQGKNNAQTPGEEDNRFGGCETVCCHNCKGTTADQGGRA